MSILGKNPELIKQLRSQLHTDDSAKLDALMGWRSNESSKPSQHDGSVCTPTEPERVDCPPSPTTPVT